MFSLSSSLFVCIIFIFSGFFICFSLKFCLLYCLLSFTQHFVLWCFLSCPFSFMSLLINCLLIQPFGYFFSDIDAPTLNASNIIIVEGSPLNIQCLSVANPSPSYEWLKQDGSFVTASQVLSFASIHRNDTASYKCRAKNSINSKESKSILIEVQSK